MPSVIVEGQVKDIVLNVRTATDQKVYVGVGPINAIIRRESDGKYWDTNDSTWQANGSVVTWPAMSHAGNGIWFYQLPSGATTTVGEVIHAHATDDEAAPASETEYSELRAYDVVQSQNFGDYVVTLHTQTSASVDIPYVRVTVMNPDEDEVIFNGVTDEEGDLTLQLDALTYDIRCLKTGHTFAAQTAAVTEDATINITGASVVAGAAKPDGCLVYGTIKAGVRPLSGATVKMRQVLTRPPTVEDSVIMAGTLLETTTNGNGYFEGEMAAGTKIQVEIPEAGLRHVIELDDVSTYDISDEWD